MNGQRRNVVYALAGNPNDVRFDVELFFSDDWPGNSEWRKWEPIAIVHGPGMLYREDDSWLFLTNNGVRYSAQQVLNGDCESVEVSLLDELMGRR